jgi:uncharacterized protein YdhG (YjbR/CyaY superfamily)
MRRFTSVADYLRAVPPAPRAALQKLRQTLKAVVPGATEVISYGIPTLVRGRWRVHFGAFKDHCSLFGIGAAVMNAYKKELAPFEMSRGTIRFTVEKPLPAALVRKLVKARLTLPGKAKPV